MPTKKIAFIVAVPGTAQSFLADHIASLQKHYEVHLIANFPEGYDGSFWFRDVIFYIFAYYFGYLWNKQVHLKFYITIFLLMVITIAIRLILKVEADAGNIIVGKIYDRVYASYSQGILGFWIFITLYWILNKFSKIRVMIYPAFLKSDKLSYFIYIVHCSFLRGVLNLNQATNSLLVNTLLFLMCTILLSIIIKAISDMITNKSFKVQTSR